MPSSSRRPGQHRNHSTRSDEINAAFDTEPTLGGSPSGVMSSGHSSPPGYDVATASSSSSRPYDTADVFFDAGDDVLPEEPPQPRRQSRSDPLGASANQQAGSDDDDDDDEDSTPIVRQTSRFATTSSNPSTQPTPTPSARQTNEGGYDFERPTYFNASRSRSASGATLDPSSSNPYGGNAEASSSSRALDSATVGQTADARGLATARRYLGRFGRFVGMRVPGAAYSSLSQADGSTGSTSRRVVGGGAINGVFANLNAKPEGRRRRRNTGDPDDRGEDDDLAEDALPPTYEIAALDAAPGYWETTIAPGGLGWTPGGAHVGDVEDLILEGLPIGNFFGFAWNLLVSMCFQFVGFLLTYLLHTTHAARCGSRAGLGVTLINYGFYLRARVAQLEDDASNGASGGHGGAVGDVNDPSAHSRTLEWLGATLVYSPAAQATPTARDGNLFVNFGEMGTATSQDMASAMASDGDNMPIQATPTDVNTGSSEWLAYLLMVVGWFILLSSLLQYFRMYKWGRALVAASRREQEAARATENGGQAPELSGSEGVDGAPVGFIHRLRAIIRPAMMPRADGRSTGTGEDWIIYPGQLRGGSASTVPTSATPASAVPIWGPAPRLGGLAYPADDDDDDDEEGDSSTRRRSEGEQLSPEVRGLLQDTSSSGLIDGMRRAGLL